MVIVALLIIALLELSLWLPQLWQARRLLARLIFGLQLLALGFLLTDFSIGLLIVSFFSVYRLSNLARVIKGHMQADYLYGVTRQTAWALISFQAVTALAFGIGVSLDIRGWYVLAGAQLVMVILLALVTRRNIKATRSLPTAATYTDTQLPTLTVAIPARNETDDLQACLESLVGSDYPKLEILVLDDCSQNRQTSEIIRGFAHGGVRFISGQMPPDNWLAKNFAYHQLAEAANGELILFCGVDVRFQPGSLRQLVTGFLDSKLKMVSWLPRNVLPHYLGGLLVQPSRYLWELALPRDWLRRPPVLSTCWLIAGQQLRESGGFSAVSRSGSPESYFARNAFNIGGYGFFQALDDVSLLSAKSLSEQLATAQRTRYLQTHRRLELVALLTLAELGLIVGPLLLAWGALVSGLIPVVALGGAASLVLALIYASVVRLAYRKFLIKGLLLYPLAALTDIGLLNYSMYKYEFSEVIWKGRNICLPVMRRPQNQPSAT